MAFDLDAPDHQLFPNGDKAGYFHMVGDEIYTIVFNGFHRMRTFSFLFSILCIENNLYIL